MQFKRSFTILAVLAAALALPVATAGAAQQFFPDDNGSLVDVATKDCPAISTVPISEGSVQTWVLDQPASVDVAFGSDDFGYDIVLDMEFTGTFVLHVGAMKSGGFYSAGEVLIASVPGQIDYVGTIPLHGDFTVATGESLAFLIDNDNGDTSGGSARRVFLATGCDGVVTNTFFTSNANDPRYPTPEMSTVLLMGAGLVAIVGVVLHRRSGA